jgi:hypothetical protein
MTYFYSLSLDKRTASTTRMQELNELAFVAASQLYRLGK